MNLLATSDLHGNLTAYKDLAFYAKNNLVDIIILAGDLSSRKDDGENDIILSVLSSINKPIVFVMGNDDTHEWQSMKNLYNINQKCFQMGNYSFVGYQYTNPFIGGLFEKNENEQKSDLDKLNTIVDDKTVLVTHGPCYGILDETNNGISVGSKALHDFVKLNKPRCHVFGHIHESFGFQDFFYNVSYPKKRKFVKIDLSRRSCEII